MIIVIPCYDEEQRFDSASFIDFLNKTANVNFVFVNDGSTDNTHVILESLRQKDPGRVQLLNLDANRGKAEAVRQGILHALESQPTYVGFWDADLATPLKVIDDFYQLLDKYPHIEMAFGARVRLLGRTIIRSPIRHYLGRASATLISLVLDLPIYDTQCGAKIFRVTHDTRHLFHQPFMTRWTFDVEIIARLIQSRNGTNLPKPGDVIYEYPLDVWNDVHGSKIKPKDYLRSLIDLWRIHRTYLSSPKPRLRS